MNNKFNGLSTIGGMALTGLAGTILAATTASAFDHRASYVNVVSSGGNGCIEVVDAHLADSGKSVVLSLDNMAVAAGAGAHPADSVAVCEVKLTVGLPDGVQYSLKGFETLAHLSIEQGGAASLQVRYGFPGTRQGLASLSFQGPAERDTLLRRDFSYLNQYFSACYSRRPVTVSVKLSSRSDYDGYAIADAELLNQTRTIKLPLVIQECE